eukprot:CAMPEP_0198134452 /NCGR_PEP_ID=MMETSP1442-20131203/60083_1 /TAXON_ID= /ORGANISM="Craspedostauros australis, Strain CCMP3328" /LENGTH=239 /DNA_ID=CAMNT_0043795595 /DNA_START=18 /DNA_END=737 /DNA_ORIENTATION=+
MKFTAALVAMTVAPVVSFSYLDNLSSPASSAPSGSGIGGYLDNLPSQPVAPVSGGTAAPGNYLDNLPGAGAPAAYDPTPSFATPAAPVTPAFVPAPAAGVSANAAPTSAGYLSNLNTGADAAPSGAGISGYLDALPRAPPTMGGAGIPSYKDSLPTAPAMIGGPGIPDYKDSLSASSSTASFQSSYAPAAASTTSPSYSSPAQTGGFTLEADNLAQALQGASGAGTIHLTGTIENVRFN